ncbi:MAG TPA: YdcF family protein [Micropepsaceae bacterium]|nr:YdcF family protein [Micropepsaceae bacterium]
MAKKHRDTFANGSKRSRRRFHLLFATALVLLLLFGIGFGGFLANLPPAASGSAAKADAIIALTGEGGRLTPAVTLLEKGSGKRLLITGVNRQTSKPFLKKLLHGGESFDCCADLGLAALDTRGNAEEAARWVTARGYHSLIIVTADYHMPRSLVEFGAQMPGVQLIPYPVAADNPRSTRWESARRLSGEYVKYLASVVRVSLFGVRRDA